MIARHWTGWVKPEAKEAYMQHLQQHLFPELVELQGYQGAVVYQRPLADAVEFLVVTNWESLEAIRQFAGDTPLIAVIPEEARQLMVRYDTEVRHYEVVE
ncbi:antibiotic biosynthesis monooxygenase family protein [Pontibacter chitinilyticus]|uniref:antibiotic biosynthesis monooxygenase family protein n=1 Tax=Pontibacter chitinilyticus TaxID=2674989 RepID=UPI00321B8EE6